jgi:hypothetical protein
MVDSSTIDISFNVDWGIPPNPVANKNSLSGVRAKSSGFLKPHQTENVSSAAHGSITADLTAFSNSPEDGLSESVPHPPRNVAMANMKKLIFILLPLIIGVTNN